MEKIAVEVVTVDTVTEEEMAKALEYIRKERQKKAEANAQAEGLRLIREGIRLIEATGKYVTLPAVGGKYVPHHHPRVQVDNLNISPFCW